MKKEPILDVKLPDFTLFDRGKVRDIFEVEGGLLVVTTDRIYAFDRVYPAGLVGKGKVLNQITLWGFDQARSFLPNYVISSRFEDFPSSLEPYSELLRDRSFLAEKITPIPLECVARGYLYGQAWKGYRQGDFFWGKKLPSGLKLAAELTEPIFTPARKNRSGEDENISWPDLQVLLGEERAEELKDFSLKIYRKLRGEWEKRGFILADTKFEFGLLKDRLVLINEVGTPDSSRFWKTSAYRPGQIQDSWDKEILEDYLRRKGWNTGSPPIPISDYIRKKLRDRFAELLSLI